MAHYFDKNPVVEHQETELEFRLHGHDFRFITDHGVFARKHLDFGSELLIETVVGDQDNRVGRLLDLGCGYGPVGIIMKRIFPSMQVVMCDINERALELARRNAKLNQTQFLEIMTSDGMQAVSGSYDLILTNPPIRAGKAVVYRFFTEAAGRLCADGRLYVVIQKKQGAASALKKLQELFESVAVLERQSGYWILRASQPHLAMPRAGVDL